MKHLLTTIGFLLMLIGVFGLCVECAPIMLLGFILSFLGGWIVLKENPKKFLDE